MSWHGLNAVELASVLLPRFLQHSQVVSAPAHTAHLLGANAGDRGEWTSSPEVTVQPEEWNIHPKSVGNNCLAIR